MLKEGDRMPDFSLPNQRGEVVEAAALAGKPLVVYFYPKDDTPGCTKEACSFRDAFREYVDRGIAVVGISADTPGAHGRFAAKYALPFTLLADPDKTVIKAFGAWGDKQMYGKTYQGVLRSTFVVGADGIVKKVFPKVNPADHAVEVLRAFDAP